jgi:hypothetical protein
MRAVCLLIGENHTAGLPVNMALGLDVYNTRMAAHRMPAFTARPTGGALRRRRAASRVAVHRTGPPAPGRRRAQRPYQPASPKVLSITDRAALARSSSCSKIPSGVHVPPSRRMPLRWAKVRACYARSARKSRVTEGRLAGRRLSCVTSSRASVAACWCPPARLPGLQRRPPSAQQDRHGFADRQVRTNAVLVTMTSPNKPGSTDKVIAERLRTAPR